MSADDDTVASPFGPISRRTALGAALLAGAAFLAPDPLSAQERRGGAASVPRKRYDMKKSINLWAFPYPQKMSLVQCLQLAKDAGFDGIELNYDLESDLSPKAGTREFQEIRNAADRIGIAISGLCSFLFWPYPLTSNDTAKRTRGLELADRMAHAAHDLGVENLLVVP
jgi:L-ribulose-5-phosphate 3-epimerase